MTNEEMFNKNVNIAYKIASKYNINYPNEYEDIKQEALIGLWKAVLNYDKDKGFAFTSFAYRVIENEINYYLRNLTKGKNYKLISMEQNIGIDELQLKDTLIDTSYSEDKILDTLEYNEIFNIRNEEIKKLSERDRAIYKELQKGKTQYEVSNLFNLSQPAIARIQKRLINKVKLKYKGGKL